MILIADSGSTKTHWKIFKQKEEIAEVFTEGINPYFQNQEKIETIITSMWPITLDKQQLNHVYYYGAGCGLNKNKQLISEVISLQFPEAAVEVETDLLGAARGACGRSPGIAAILGTGSNSCDYDGCNIVANMPSLGFILGDEGSGAYIGKQFIQDLLTNDLPSDLKNKFLEKNPLTQADVLQAVYKLPNPNRYLASFTKFLGDHSSEHYVEQLVYSAFDLFFDKHILRYKLVREKPLSSVGSIGFYFSKILISVAEKNGIQIKHILEKPMDGIVEYHLN